MVSYRVIRKFGVYEPGDLLVGTPARVRELAFCKFAEPIEAPRSQQPAVAPAPETKPQKRSKP